MRTLIRMVVTLVIAGSSAWTAMALYFGPTEARGLGFAMGAVGAAAVLSVFRPGLRRAALPMLVVSLGAFAAWWATVKPSNDRDWQPEVAVLPYATFAGDRVTIHNIRNFESSRPSSWGATS